MKPRYGQMADKIRELCSRSIGCSLREAAEAINRPLNIASVYVVNLVKTGSVVKAGVHGEYRYFRDPEDAQAHDIAAKRERLERMEESAKKKREYHAKRHRDQRARTRAEKGLPTYEEELRMREEKKKKVDLTPRISGIVVSTRIQDLEGKKLHQQAKVTWPEHVKVETVPGFVGDPRFKFEAPEGWQGEFTKEWQEKRKPVN